MTILTSLDTFSYKNETDWFLLTNFPKEFSFLKRVKGVVQR